MECQIQNDDRVIDCGVHLGIESIHDYYKILAEALLEERPIILQAGKITQVDTCALQLLLIFIREASKKNIRWEWQAPSHQLMYVANLLGLRELLKLPENK